MLCGGIEDTTAQALADVIANDLPDNTHTLYILFSTGGGSVTFGFAIYNLLRALPYKIIMHNIGSVDSIGVVIFLAGEERYTTSHGTFLIHWVKSTAKYEKLEDGSVHERLSCIEGEEKKINDIIVRYSNIPQEEFEQLFEYGELKDAEYALKRGLVEDIREFEIPKGAPILVVKTNSSGPGEENL